MGGPMIRTNVTMLGVGDFPLWLTAVSVASLVVAALCAAWVTFDVLARPQKMTVMNFVWPITMLFGSLLWLWLYVRRGRMPTKQQQEAESGSMPDVPFRVAVAKGASHCGAGCSMGDLVGEFGVVLFPALLVTAGYGNLFSDEIYARWVIDFVIAFAFGIVFQYFTIAPMQNLSFGSGIWQAVKADTASITAWQIGMYGMMALAQFWIIPAIFDGRVAVLTPEFWWIMQLAMLAGFATSYPVNWWLVRIGVKEAM